MEMLYEALLVMSRPFLVQVKVVGGPPLVAPRRVNVGGSDRNEEGEVRETWLPVIVPRPVGRKNYEHQLSTLVRPVQIAHRANLLKNKHTFIGYYRCYPSSNTNA